MSKYEIEVRGLGAANSERFENACLEVKGVKKVDSWPGRAILATVTGFDASVLHAALLEAGFEVGQRPCETDVPIEGMTCHSCEVFVERRLRKLPGVTAVNADSATGRVHLATSSGAPDMNAVAAALEGSKYSVLGQSALTNGRPNGKLILEAFVFAAVILYALSRFDPARTFGIGSGTAASFASAVLLGLVAGSSSCIAVSGGLLLSVAARHRAKFAKAAPVRPVATFIVGRTVSYAVLGALIGALGTALTPTPLATGIITIAAAMIMLVAGLDMLGIAPRWLKVAIPSMPKSLAHRVFETDEKDLGIAPAAFGAATFFIPCGFTQALQIYALTSGGAISGALLLGGFALGTAPALAALGWASTALKGRAGERFMRFSGALVILLGLFNIQNGFIAAGFTLVATPSESPGSQDVKIVEGVQVVRMALTDSNPYYAPGNVITVRAGQPVRLEISGRGAGCRTVFQIPSQGVRLALTQELNVAEFTPLVAGTSSFSCSMGMYPGTLIVEPAS